MLWIPHIDGISFRSLADEYDISPAKAIRIVEEEMNNLPDNTWLTAKYCNRFSGILVIDGKYVKVKGYDKKIPFIYSIDYLSHDIIAGVLAPSENEEAFRKLFRLIKTCNYPLQVVVCDDVISSLKHGLFYQYPKANIQLCNNHYLENIRQNLKIRTTENHRKFFRILCKHVFREYKNQKQLKAVLHHMLTKHAKKDVTRQNIIMDIFKKRNYLFTHKRILHCPKDTNLLELFNSHLNGRIRNLKGFQSFNSAQRWLNAWMIRRRTKPFTDCEGKFKKLNGKTSLEITIKKQANLPDLFNKYQLKMKR